MSRIPPEMRIKMKIKAMEIRQRHKVISAEKLAQKVCDALGIELIIDKEFNPEIPKRILGANL